MSNTVSFDTDLPLGAILRTSDKRPMFELRLHNGRKKFYNIHGNCWDTSVGFNDRYVFERIWDVYIPKESNILKLLKRVDEA